MNGDIKNKTDGEFFRRRAAEVGLDLSLEDADRVVNGSLLPTAIYKSVRSSSYEGCEPANVFQPVGRPDCRYSQNASRGDASVTRTPIHRFSTLDSSEEEDIAFASIYELAPLIQNGELSPVRLTEICINRIERLDHKISSFLTVFREEALSAAEKAEREIKAGDWRGPLHGVPIGLKDIVNVYGKATTCGSPALRDNTARADSTIWARLKRAGAILLGKTNLVEFALGASGVNPHTGTPQNPWLQDRVTAGSSSGSGAAVAAGFAFGAIGSDTGGSIRMPAALCGISGLKPTYGRVPRTGVFPLSWSLDHVGPMARSAIDCALMLNVLAGYDPLDSSSFDLPAEDFTVQTGQGFQGLRLGLPDHYFFENLDAEIREAVHSAVQKMEGAGAEVVELPMPWASEGRAINLAVLLPEAVSVHERLIAEKPEGYSVAVRSRIQAGFNVPAVDYLRTQRARRRFAERMADVMAEVDVLITPSCPVKAPTIEECSRLEPSEAATRLPAFTGAFNTSGQPSISVNSGFTKEGLPIGMMITAHSFEDAVALRVGAAWEHVYANRRRPAL